MFYFIVLNSAFMSVVTLFYVPLARFLIAIDCEPSISHCHSAAPWELEPITVYSR